MGTKKTMVAWGLRTLPYDRVQGSQAHLADFTALQAPRGGMETGAEIAEEGARHFC